MDDKRAREIIASQGVIEVLYQGSPVWLENVTQNNTALVHYISNNKKEEIPIYKLVENENAMH